MNRPYQGETIENTPSPSSPQQEIVKDTRVYTAYPMESATEPTETAADRQEQETAQPPYEAPRQHYHQGRNGYYQQYGADRRTERAPQGQPPPNSSTNSRQNNHTTPDNQQSSSRYGYSNGYGGQSQFRPHYQQAQNSNTNQTNPQTNPPPNNPSMTQLFNQILQSLQQNGMGTPQGEGAATTGNAAHSGNAGTASLLTQLAPVIKSFLNQNSGAAGQNGNAMQTITNFINQNGGMGAVLNSLGAINGGLGNTSSAASAATGGGLLGGLGSYLGRTLKGKPLRANPMNPINPMNPMGQSHYAQGNSGGYGVPRAGSPHVPFQGTPGAGQPLPSWQEVQQMVNHWRK